MSLRGARWLDARYGNPYRLSRRTAPEHGWCAITKPHHRGARFEQLGKLIRRTAGADPGAVCWRDGLTMTQHRERWPTAALTWTAGHTGDRWNWQPWLDVTHQPPVGNWLAPEVSRCNYAAGGTAGNAGKPHTRRRRNPTSRPW